MNIRRTLLTGFFVVLPLVITYWVIRLIFLQVASSVTPLIYQVVRVVAPGPWMQQAWVDYFAPLVSVILVLTVIYVIGLVGGNVLGRQVLKAVERLLLRVPVVRGIYSATRQFLDTFSRPEGRSFRAVVLVEFPKPKTWALGLLTSETEGEVQARTRRPVVSVFVPTTPNPTSGYLIFVDKDEVIELDMSIDDAFKMIVSGGVLTPPYSSSATLGASSGS